MVPYWLAMTWLWAGCALSAWLLLRRRKKPSVAELLVTTPPEGFSPAAIRYLFQAGYDNTCLVVSALNAAVHSAYAIAWKPTGFAAYRRPGTATQHLVSPEERAVFLKEDGQWVEKIFLGGKNDGFTLKAEGRLFFHLRKHYRKWLFPRNIVFVLVSLMLTLGVVLVTRMFDPGGDSRWHLNCLVVSFGVATPALVLGTYHLFESFHPGDQSQWMLTGVMIFFGAVILYTELIASHSIMRYTFPFALLEGWIVWHLPAYAPRFRRQAKAIADYREFLLARTRTGVPFNETEYHMVPYLVALDIPFDKDAYFESLLSE